LFAYCKKIVFYNTMILLIAPVVWASPETSSCPQLNYINLSVDDGVTCLDFEALCVSLMQRDLALENLNRRSPARAQLMMGIGLTNEAMTITLGEQEIVKPLTCAEGGTKAYTGLASLHLVTAVDPLIPAEADLGGVWLQLSGRAQRLLPGLVAGLRYQPLDPWLDTLNVWLGSDVGWAALVPTEGALPGHRLDASLVLEAWPAGLRAGPFVHLSTGVMYITATFEPEQDVPPLWQPQLNAGVGLRLPADRPQAGTLSLIVEGSPLEFAINSEIYEPMRAHLRIGGAFFLSRRATFSAQP
jgi:hypothetical protein